MPVTDQQVATLRAQLAGNLEEHKRLLKQLDRRADGLGYGAMVTGAFFEAVDRRFAKDTTRDDVIEFVADVRSRTEDVRDALDPGVAERVLLAALEQADIGDLDAEPARRSQTYLLAAMVVDEQFDDAALDEFMARARTVANSLLG